MKRLEKKFAELKTQNKCGFIGYICAGDPDYETSLSILKALPSAGVDVIELGVPFLDPAGDGPIIESASKRAIANGMTLAKTLEMVREFRKFNSQTPLILMGYYNPLLKYGIDKVFVDAYAAGVDGFLIVDLPLEEEGEILAEIKKSNLDLIGLIAPTTSQERAKKIAQNSSGFLYLISMLGITGSKEAEVEPNKISLQKLREVSNLPIAIGFGIKTPQIAYKFSKIGADAVIVGSTIVKEISDNFLDNQTKEEIITKTSELIKNFSIKIKS